MTRKLKALRHILVIDNDPECNFLTREAFLDTGLQCKLTFRMSAQEGLDYLAALGDDFPDLILLDIHMPMLDGWDFMREFERLNYHRAHSTGVIVVSSSVYLEDRGRALNCPNVVEYFEKPLTCDHFFHIRDAFKKHISRRSG